MAVEGLVPRGGGVLGVLTGEHGVVEEGRGDWGGGGEGEGVPGGGQGGGEAGEELEVTLHLLQGGRLLG